MHARFRSCNAHTHARRVLLLYRLWLVFQGLGCALPDIPDFETTRQTSITEDEPRSLLAAEQQTKKDEDRVKATEILLIHISINFDAHSMPTTEVSG